MKILVILATLSFSSGMQYNGLRVKFGWSDALADKEYFFNIPRILSQAESDGWRRMERPPGPLPELRLYCPVGRAVCPLYDPSGFVAGLQLAFPVDEIITPSFKPDKRFTKWSVPASDGEPAREYWTITQFLVSEESLKAGAGPQVENGATLQDGGVWVKDLEGQYIRIPSTEAELNTTQFKKQNCIPNMGTHYYYNMSRETSCENLLPWFALTTRGYLVGVGFQVVGKLTKPTVGRDWFEVVNSRQAVKTVAPFAPECLLKLSDNYPILSLHIYYIDKPWTVKCRSGDSIAPASPLDRLLLNGQRYTTVVVDELKKIFYSY
ncbi:uncharacterized protein LOC116773093 [Danaus plexippus]|uniref:uncharacterized protein LOC116773093 n=1 Tax=Danaus plexippus TaxID=13037 RepID=UPI002AB16C27|nr:uncharacterized protein LOC116773093 [Danaus plexippus]